MREKANLIFQTVFADSVRKKVENIILILASFGFIIHLLLIFLKELTLIEVILLKNGITDYTPTLLTNIEAEKSPPEPLPITEELEEEDWV